MEGEKRRGCGEDGELCMRLACPVCRPEPPEPPKPPELPRRQRRRISPLGLALLGMLLLPPPGGGHSGAR